MGGKPINSDLTILRPREGYLREALALLRELRDDAVCFPAPKQSGHTTGTSRRANVSWDLVVRAGALLERIERKEAGDARDRD